MNSYDEKINSIIEEQKSNDLTLIKVSPSTQFSLSEWETEPITLIYLRAHALYSWAEMNGSEDDYGEALTLISTTIEGEPNQSAYKKLRGKLSQLPTQL